VRLALVYDRVNKIGGAERVLTTLHKIWPEAPLFTSVYNPKTTPWVRDFKIIPSFLQKIPGAKSRHEWLLPLMPRVFESFDFRKFDVVISITSAEAKGIITPPSTLHICYCLTPTRYLWSGRKDYEGELGRLGKSGMAFWGPVLRQWDFVASRRPDIFWAISKTVQARIRKYYRRESEVIYPPATKLPANNQQSAISNQQFYLIVSRLVPYKRIDLAVRAFNKLGKNLIIIGQGMEKQNLTKIAKKNVKFIDRLTDKQLAGYYMSCRALVFPGEEDFGLVGLEAQSFGKSVIGFKKGGLEETVIHGKTGWLFKKQTTNSLIQAIKEFEKRKFSVKACQTRASKFTERTFIKKFKNKAEAAWQKHKKNI